MRQRCGLVLGIDPGADGGFALVCEDGRAWAWPMPETPTRILAEMEEHGRPGLVVLESVHAMPGQGVSSCFSFGQAFGVLNALCAFLRLPVVTVSPQRWQRHIHGRLPGEDGKKLTTDWAAKRFPAISLLRTPRCKVPHDGMADALGLAVYGCEAYSWFLE